MKIAEIVSKYYDYFHSLLPNTDTEIYGGNTYEDILSNVIITAMNKFGENGIEELQGYDYIRKTLLTEILFSKKRKAKDKLLITENLIAYDYGTCEE